MAMNQRFGFRFPPMQAKERRYLIGLGAILALFGVGQASAQLWLNYGPDLNRALAWVRGAQELGVSHLQHPVLRQASFPKVAAQQRGIAAAHRIHLGFCDPGSLLGGDALHVKTPPCVVT